MKKTVLILGILSSFNANAWSPCGIDEHGNVANCEYQIDAQGTLTIRGTGNNGNIGNWGELTSNGSSLVTTAPWGSYQDRIENIVIENSIKDLGSYGFVRIKSAAAVNIPEGVTNISSNAFYSSSASEIIIPNTVTEIESSAFNWSSIKKIDIPDSVKNIGGSFRGAGGLKNLIIPDSVVYMSKESLSYTDLETLTISDKTALGEIFTGYGEESYVNFSNLKIYCTGDTAKCDANLEAAGYPQLKSQKATTQKINGVTYVYDNKGKLVTTSGHRKEKRIYTIEEANAVAKPTGNTARLKYR